MTPKFLLTVFLTLLIGLVSIFIGIWQTQKFDIDGLEREKANLQAEKFELMEKAKVLEVKIQEIMMDRNGPALLFPENQSTLLGKAVRLQWQPTQKRVSVPVYILNYFRLSPPNFSTKLVVDPSEEPEWTLFFRVPSEQDVHSGNPEAKNLYGDYLWCVQEGTAGSTSSCRTFSMFESAWQRMKQTGKILVGVTEGGRFNHLKTETGKPNGFEVDLIHWVVKGINTTLGRGTEPLTVEFIYRPFEDLLPELNQGKFDIALSQFTITQERENNFPHMKFSRGYFINNQILIKNTQSAKKLSEKGTILGVIKNSSNKQAALHLQEKLKYLYEVKEYDSLGRLINDLLDGNVHFTLVDVVSPVVDLARQRKDLKQYSDEKKLKTGLESFYKQQMEQGKGRAFEEFGIAVSTRSDKNMQLLEEINRLLCSQEGHKKIRSLIGEYGFDETSIPEPIHEGSGC